MPLTYSPTTWVDAVTPADQTNMNNLEGGVSQATTALNTLEGGSYALSLASVATTGNGTIGGHLTITGYLSSDAGHILSDGSGKLTIAKLSSDSAAITSDGAGKLTIASISSDSGRIFSDGSGNFHIAGTIYGGSGVLTIGDKLSLDSAAITSDGAGKLTIAKLNSDAGAITTDGAGNATLGTIHTIGGINYLDADSSNYDVLQMRAKSTSYAGSFGWGDTSYGSGAGFYIYDLQGAGYVLSNATKSGVTFGGNISGPVGGGIPMTRNGTAISAPMMTGSSLPTHAAPGAVFVMA